MDGRILRADRYLPPCGTASEIVESRVFGFAPTPTIVLIVARSGHSPVSPKHLL
jgi:hypothetical protein